MMLPIFASIASVSLVLWSDRHSLRLRTIPLGTTVVVVYSLTYGLGLALWMSDPSSLFGYGTQSTLGALYNLSLAYSLFISIFAATYCALTLVVCNPRPSSSLIIFKNHSKALSRLSLLVLACSSLAQLLMLLLGLFSRDPQFQSSALQSSVLAKALVGTSLVSRLAPVALILIVPSWKNWTPLSRNISVLLMSLWLMVSMASSSRGLLISLPLYLFLGLLIFRRVTVKIFILGALVSGLIFVPVAETIRVSREGDNSNSELTRKYELFQIGKQLMGTTHEFYLFLQSSDCQSDLARQLSNDPSLSRLLGIPAEDLPPLSNQRWNVVRLYEACANRSLGLRQLQGFERLPLGFIPNSLVPSAPSLFDGQSQIESLSHELGLRPGEISQGTLSLFADAWWRYRWLGVALSGFILGLLLFSFQRLFYFLMLKMPQFGLLAQLLGLSLIGTWINNTALTMLWFLFWDLPKSWVELSLILLLSRCKSKEK